MAISKERLCLYSSIDPSRSSSREIIRAAYGLGVGGVELMSFCEELSTPDISVARELGDMARGYGLKIPCFSVFADIENKGEGEIERLSRYAEICAELSIPYFHHTVAPDLSAYSASDDEREQRFLRSLDSLLCFDEFVSSLGVKILIEDQGFMLNGARNCRRICDASGGRIGILADIGNIFFVDETPEQLLNEVGDFVRHVHVKDYTITDSKIDGKRNCVTLGGRIMNDAEIGTGDVNVAYSLSLLERIGYGGMYSLEFAKVKDGEVERVIRRITGGC